MKRLKKYFLEMEKTDVTYNAVYNGIVGFSKNGMVLNNPHMKGAVDDPEYWYGDISFTLQRSSKKTPDLAMIRISIPLSKFPFSISSHDYDVVIADRLLRKFIPHIEEINQELYHPKKKKSETGYLYIHTPDSKVLLRNSAYICRAAEERFLVSLPCQFPLHNHKKAARILCSTLPETVDRFIASVDEACITESISLYQTQEEIRTYLSEHDLCAFVANDSNLLNTPDCIPFQSPKELEQTIAGISGMVIPKGITAIIGGGFSGKSTLLEAIRSGIYNHTAEVGRKYVITVNDTAYVMAEDGRTIHNTDISYFVKQIPHSDTRCFSTSDASGSTSEAANVIEAMQMGAKLLLIDEDKSAANFLIRDARMDALIKENPIIPLSDRLSDIRNQYGVSVILVVGANYELLNYADTILSVENYQVSVYKQPNVFKYPTEAVWRFSVKNYPPPELYDESGTEHLEVSPLGYLVIGNASVYTKPLKTIESFAQLCTIGGLLKKLYWAKEAGQCGDIIPFLREILTSMNGQSINALSCGEGIYWLEIPRLFDVLAVMNRL